LECATISGLLAELQKMPIPVLFYLINFSPIYSGTISS
jgi:hypothetical protein